MEKKYELTDETIKVGCHVLHRIRAVRDFGDVKAGDLGGWIESEGNLSHSGDCWVYGGSCVFENARVYGDAEVYNNAHVSGNARVYGYAQVSGDAQVFGDAQVCGNAHVYGNALVCGNAHVYGDAGVGGDARIGGNSRVYGDAEVGGYARVSGDAKIGSDRDYIVFKNWWSSGRYFTWTRSNNMWKVGCFYGTGAELIAKAYKDSEDSGREYERVVKYVESVLADEKKDN